MYFKYLIILLPFLFAFNRCDDGHSDMKEVTAFALKNPSVPGTYRNLDGIYASLNEIKENYPESVKLYTVGYGAQTARPIPLVRIGKQMGDHPVRFLFVAGTHGNEGAPVEAIMYVINDLLAEGNSPGDLILDFIPVHNPDGYAENTRENGIGIDLNRDFPVGRSATQLQPETVTLMNLINRFQYKASLFFHSGNEKKYENLIRIPMEFNSLGVDAFGMKFAAELNHLADIVQTAGNIHHPAVPWRRASNMVKFSGIASDWCSGGFMKPDYRHPGEMICEKSHPSLTIELCYPKQPSDPLQLQEESQELDRIIRALILYF